MGLGALNPGCECDCCRIWLDNCHVRWACSSDTVQVYRNGVLFSTQRSGSVYRPTPGLWELRACSGVGCTPIVVSSVNVPSLSTAQCPLPPNCCFEKQFARYQVPTFQYAISSQTSRDYRVNVNGQLLGRNCTLIRLRESIAFDFGGSYLFPLQPGCSHSINQLLGTATLISEGLITGTETSRQPGNGALLTCNLNVVTYAEIDVEIWARRNLNLTSLGFEAKPLGGYWQALYQGTGYQTRQPVVFNCDQRYLPFEEVFAMQPREIARHSPQRSVAGLCEFSGPWIVGPSNLSGIFNYGLWLGAYEFIVGGGTTFASVAEDLVARQNFPAVTPPFWNAGLGWFDYV